MALDPVALYIAVQAAALTPVEKTFYRSVDFTFLRQHDLSMLDGRHAGHVGGRYNPPGAEPIAYFAGSQTAAALECEQQRYILGVGTQTPNPRLTVALTIASSRVLDLSNPVVLRNLGVARNELLVPTLQWKLLNAAGTLCASQQLGAAARARGDIDGLLVPSWVLELLPPNTLPPAPNLVLFMDPDRPSRACGETRGTATVQVHDPTGLVP